MKSIKIVTVFTIIMIMVLQAAVYAQLSYAEGGPSVEDPGLEVAPELRRYVDAVDGNDANDGKSPVTAWQTVSKVNNESSSFLPGIHILFKRGQSWSDHLGSNNTPPGEENKRIVYGAYGSLSDARPKINNGIAATTYYMVRDMQAHTFYMGKNGDHHSVFYNNICFGGGNNGMMIIGDYHHGTIVGNIIYDLGNNDCISVHQRDWITPHENVKSHHWILDNITIGHENMEDGIDVAMGDDRPLEGDVKVIANLVQMDAVPGLSEKTGKGNVGIALGHEGHYNWIIGNIVSGGNGIAYSVGHLHENIKVSGNIAFKGNRTPDINLNGENIEFYNNTNFNYDGRATAVELKTKTLSFTKNIILRPEGGYWAQIFDNPTEMDYNWWGESENPVIDGKSFSEWQSTTGHDLNSDKGAVPGFSQPADDAYNHDPRNWNDSTFLAQFIPSSDFSGLGGIIPGAFDKNGKRQGMAILPFEDSDLENGGLGWEGPLIVQQRLRELGISWGEPLLAKYPKPKNESTNVSIKSDLSWTAGDSTISHDVYLGTHPDSLVLMGNQDGLTYDPDTLYYETTYFWRVDQVTADGTYDGNIWSFTTEWTPTAPGEVSNPNPADNAVDQRTSLLLSWQSGVRTVSSDVYFGTSNPPALTGNQTGNSYSVSNLELNTTYYWRIDGNNEWGKTEGVVWQFTTQAVPTLPAGWAGLDIGDVGIGGDDDFDNGSFTVTASGAGIGDNADQFHFVYHALKDGGYLSARVVSLDNTDPSAMAGVMIRDKLESTSAHHMSGITAGQGAKATWRLYDPGNTDSQSGTSVSAPYWFKIQRAGDYLLSYESADGIIWKALKTEQINMQSDVYVGLTVTASNNDSLCTAVFDNVILNGEAVAALESPPVTNLIPKEFTVGNYPNPFNPLTTIRFDLPKAGDVKIRIYDISGRLINEVFSGRQNAGSHTVIWNGKNRQGVQSATGVYLYRVQYNQNVKTGKMILMK